jgi:hypothetical protein
MTIRIPLLAWLIALGAAPPVQADGTTRARGDLAIRARAILRTYCHSCHGGETTRGRLDVLDFKSLTRADVPVPFLEPGSKTSQILELIEDGSMPPGGRKRPSPDELKVLRNWAETEKAPQFPKTFDENWVKDRVHADLQQLPPEERKGARYVSFAHLLRDDSPLLDLTQYERKLKEALFTASEGKIKTWVYVDETATIFRLDIRPARWDDRNLFWDVSRNGPGTVADLTPFDLLLLEYSFASSARTDPPTPGGPKPTYLSTLRRISFLRGDWLAEALLDGEKLTPLADDLKALTQLSLAPEKYKSGPAFRPFTRTTPLKPDTPPLGSWMYADLGPSPLLTMKVKVIIPSGGMEIETVKKDGVFSLLVTPLREAHLDLIQIDPVGAVTLRPLSASSQKIDANKTVKLAPDGGGGFTFLELPTGVTSATGYMILYGSTQRTAVPTLVKSKHPDNPIWRVFPTDPDAATTTMRVVLPLKVTQ